MSPWIHEQFLNKAELDGTYSLAEINPEENFEEKLKQLKNEETDGFNITAPYKEKIIPFLDRLDDTAKHMQAVNTVVAKDGKWYGYNTDSQGFMRSLENSYPDYFEKEEKKTLIIGAGGAARAIYYGLVTSGITEVDIANRTLSKAEEIAALGKGKTTTMVHTIDQAEKLQHTYDLIIQTTSIGMNQSADQTVITIKNLKKDAIVSDIIYQPIKTKFLKEAEQANGRIHFGHAMLLYQAQYAFEIFTGNLVDATRMDDKLKQILEGR